MADRSASDVIVQPVRITPQPKTNTFQVELFKCDGCGVMPTTPEGQLTLWLVQSPDRHGSAHQNLFLGPNCKDREIMRYTRGMPTE